MDEGRYELAELFDTVLDLCRLVNTCSIVVGQDFIPRRGLAGSARCGGGGHSGGGHVEVALAISHLGEVSLDLEYQTGRRNNVMPSSRG